MSFLNFLKRPKKEEVSIIYDITSGTVGVALVKYKPGFSPEIIYTRRQNILFKNKPNSQGLLAEMLRIVALLGEGVTKELRNFSIHRVFYVFSSPWTISQTATINYNQAKETRVTHSLVNSIISNEQKKFAVTEFKNTDGFLKDFGTDTVLVEHKAIAMRLNGYHCGNPYGKRAHSIEISYFTSVIGDAILSMIEHENAKIFNFRKSIVHSSSLLSYSSLRDIFGGVESFLTIDINGELTDMYIVKDGVLLHNASFPLGINSIIRKISSSLAIELTLAESLLQVYANGKAEHETAARLKSILLDMQKEWLELFHNSLSRLGNDIALPRTMFVIAGNTIGSFFAEFLKNEKFSQLGLTDESFTVVFIDTPRVLNFCNVSTTAKIDTVLSLQAIALNKLYI